MYSYNLNLNLIELILLSALKSSLPFWLTYVVFPYWCIIFQPPRTQNSVWPSFPNLYAHECKCPMCSKLCFLDVSGHTVHFSRVAVGNLHPAHQRSKAPVSPWPVLHFWCWHFIQHGPFDRWEARLLCSADLPFHVAWLAKKGVCVFSWIYSGKNAYALFGQGHHCRGFAAFPVL